MKPILRWIAPRILAAFAVCFLALGSGGSTCIRTPVGPTPPADAGTFTDCSEAALHAAELRLLPSLENAVALMPYSSAEAAIASIVASEAASVGAPLALAEANCVLNWILSKAQSAAATTADSLEATKASNAAAWLKAHPANITGVAAVSQ